MSASKPTIKHSPTPWNVRGGSIHAASKTPLSTGEIAVCLVNEVEALGFELVGAPLPAGLNADFIVRACNAHDELVAALRDMTRIARTASIGVKVNAKRIEKAEAALAKAGTP